MAERFRRRDSLTDLHDAVLKNSIVELQSHIHNGVPLDVTDHEGKTALYYASEKGYLSLVEVLVKNGADMEIVNINGSSCLWEASHRGYDQIVLYVLKSGANPNSQADDQTTALYWASYNGHAKCVYYLTRFNADPSQTKNTGASALFVAARNGHHCIVKHLLKCGVDANLCQQDMRSPIHTALLYHRKRCVKFLLKWNVCVTNTDMYGLSVLHFAAKCGKLKAARIILNHLRRHNLLDTDASDNFGNTCLHLAVVYGNYKLACYFISKGFNINKQNIHGWSPLHMAAMVGNDSLLKHMLEKKADCSLVTRQNETGHQIAGRYRRHSSVQLFLPSEQLSVDPLLNVNTLRDYLSLLSVTNTIGVIKYTDEEQLIKEEVETYVKHLLIHVEHLNSIFKCEIIPSGSFYEYTRVGFPTEFDFMINLIWFGRICEFQQLEEDPAGFGRLLVTNDKTHKELEQYIEPITQCLSSEKIRKRFYQLLTSARSHVIRKESMSLFKNLKMQWTSADKRCGTAIHAEWCGCQYAHLTIKIDVIPCITVPGWPSSANIPCPVDILNFHVIARSTKSDLTYLWRISTTAAEVNFFQNVSLKEKKIGYIVLKAIRNSFSYPPITIKGVTYGVEDLLTSYTLKMEYLYELNKHPKNREWIGENFSHRIMSIFKRMYKDINLGTIKSFYIKNYNILDCEEFDLLRTHELKYTHSIKLHLKNIINMQQPARMVRSNSYAADSLPKTVQLKKRSQSTV